MIKATERRDKRNSVELNEWDDGNMKYVKGIILAVNNLFLLF